MQNWRCHKGGVLEARIAEEWLYRSGGACDSPSCHASAQIFAELAKVGPQYGELDERGEAVQLMPFHIVEPHPGLRAYPFLSQARSPAVLVWQRLQQLGALYTSVATSEVAGRV